MGMSWRRVRWVAGLILGLAAGVSAPTAAVLHAITVDGNLADWNDVLADAVQTSFDGPAAGLTDRDAPVQSTGRDLATFAWTYDSSYVYWYVGRVGSISNVQQFWFYVDTDTDGRMDTGEPVINVSWTGSNRRTIISKYIYNGTAGAGDPLGDAAGFADGWDMPGTVTPLGTVETLTGGSATGTAMESRISWANLGIPFATPVHYHVSASNSTNLPSQIDDNMAGPGGQVGTIAIARITVAPNRASTVAPSGIGVLAHTVTNGGASVDRGNLAWTAAGGAFAPTSVAFYRDLNVDGLFDAGDLLLLDTDGDTLPDTGPLAAGDSLHILAVPQVPAGVTDGQVATLTVTASSSIQPPVTSTVTDTLTVATPRLTLVKSVSAATVAPGGRLTYSVSYANAGTVAAVGAILIDRVPSPAVFVTGSAAGAGTTIGFSHDGGLTFNASQSAPVTHVRWALAAALAPGAAGSVSFQVDVP
jgi:uncharacterized repeat protein (TIGR01451 family)